MLGDLPASVVVGLEAQEQEQVQAVVVLGQGVIEEFGTVHSPGMGHRVLRPGVSWLLPDGRHIL